MKWKTEVQLGRVNYSLILPRDTGEMSEKFGTPWVFDVPIDQMVQFNPSVALHNDSFIQQECSDTPRTITNHFNGLYWATQAQIDIRDKLFDNQLIRLENLNIQRQHGAPWSGLTFNIDEGGMIDEYIILSRAPLYDDNLPANGVPKQLPIDFGLEAGWDLGTMDDIILCERRRYQPDARFIATQPQTAATTYGDLGSPPINDRDAGTRRFVSFSVADVQTWGDTNAPINGPTIYVYRYVRMYAAQRNAQAFGTAYPGTTSGPFKADNYEMLQMNLQVFFPAVHITLEGEAYDANLGQLAVAYEKSLLQRKRLERDVQRGRN